MWYLAMIIPVLHELNLIKCVINSQASSFHLNVGMVEIPPFYFSERNLHSLTDKNKSEIFLGISPLTIDWLARRLNFTYGIVATGTDAGSSILVNGIRKWSGAIGRLVDNEFDIVATPLQLSSSKIRDIDFMGFDVDLSAMVMPAPTERSSILSTIRPFTTLVWSMILISLVAMALCISLTSMPMSESFKLKQLIEIHNHILYLLAILVNQGEIFYNKKFRFRPSFRFACATWCLLCVVVLNVYAGTLVSHITSRRMNSPSETMPEFLDEGLYSFLHVSSMLSVELYEANSKDPVFTRLNGLLREHPENMVPNSEVAFQKVTTGCCAYYDTISFLEYRTMYDFLEHGFCRVAIGKCVSGYSLYGMGISKSHPNKDLINHRYLELKQAGLVEYWRGKFTRGRTACYRFLLTRNQRMTRVRKLTLTDLGSAFFLLGILCLISLLLFILEMMKATVSSLVSSKIRDIDSSVSI